LQGTTTTTGPTGPDSPYVYADITLFTENPEPGEGDQYITLQAPVTVAATYIWVTGFQWSGTVPPYTLIDVYITGTSPNWTIRARFYLNNVPMVTSSAFNYAYII
jgi:hypothetical protein